MRVLGLLGRLVDDGGLGVLVRPGDPAELAAALAGLRRDPTMRAELGLSPANLAWELLAQGPDGAVWLLEDGGRGSQGRLLKLTPA